MNKIIIVLIFFSTNLGFSQSLSGTFQGQIAGNTQFFLHIEATDRKLTGFYKYQGNNFVVPLKGTLDEEGNFMFSGNNNSYPMLSGTLQNRLVKGTFIESKKTTPQPFYAVNLRGEYSGYCDYYYGISLILSEKGYLLNGCSITTHQQDDGSIYILCDSLNTKLFVRDSILVVDTKYGQPSFLYKKIDRDDELIFTLSEEFISGVSRIEFPEKFEDNEEFFSITETEIELNDNYSIRLRRIRPSEYVIRKWESEQLKHKPYKEISDLKEAQKMLGKKMKIFEIQEDEWKHIEIEITFNDGVKKRLDSEHVFWKYYPELKVLVFEGGHGSDVPYDLNDSNDGERAGNPYYHVVSPDKQLRINGFHDGQDGVVYFLEKWNSKGKRYKFVAFLTVENSIFYYSHDWFWSNNSKAFFKHSWGDYGSCYEMEVIVK